MNILPLINDTPLPKRVARGKTLSTQRVYNMVKATVMTMKIGQHFVVQDEKYARYASDFAKTIIKGNGEPKRVSFRELPNTGAKYGVWRVA